MSAQNPLTTGEKDAMQWADEFTLEDCLVQGRKLREEELELHEQLAEIQRRREPVGNRLQVVQYRIEALKHRLARDL